MRSEPDIDGHAALTYSEADDPDRSFGNSRVASFE